MFFVLKIFYLLLIKLFVVIQKQIISNEKKKKFEF